MKNKIIAVDGYASTGKTTLSKKIAKYMKFVHIDTGSMYKHSLYLQLKWFI